MPIKRPLLPKNKFFKALLAPVYEYIDRKSIVVGSGLSESEHGTSGRLLSLRARGSMSARLQFEIYRDGDDIRVAAGTLASTTLHPNNGGDTASAMPLVFGTSVPAYSFQYSASTTYGIWIDLTMGAAGTLYRPRLGVVGKLQQEGFGSSNITHSATHTGASDGPDFIAEAATRGLVFLGTVTVDGDGEVSIAQSLFGPIPLGLPTYLTDLISVAQNLLSVDDDDNGLKVKVVSTDDDNEITEGADEAAFLHPIISTDANNKITEGTDGGAMIESFVSEDDDNDLSEGEDGGVYYDDPDY